MVIYLAILTLPFGYGFLFYDYPCFTPCTCPPADHLIPTADCSNLSLTNIPTFDDLQDPFERYPSSIPRYKMKFIKLNLNQITTIPSRAFAQLGSRYPGDELKFDLSYNLIVRIMDNAFEGLENNTLSLYLHMNLLTSIPMAFMNVINLELLDISANPLQVIDSTTMTQLAPSLEWFYISLNKFTTMPDAMAVLRTGSLHIDGLQEKQLGEHLQNDNYTGNIFELYITNSSIVDVSTIPCRFHKLQHLVLSGNYQLNASPFKYCQNNATRLPSYKYFQLDITWCNLTQFEMSVYLDVTYFSLKDNQLDHVPACIANLTRINTLNLSNNRITHISNNNFQGVITLYILILENNPLRSISDSAFKSSDLQYLLLKDTQLITIPPALVELRFIMSLDLPDTIQCTCDSLGSLKGMAFTSRNAKCANKPDKYVTEYLQNDLQTCP